MTVQHPGTSGRRGWDRVEAKVVPLITKAFDGEAAKAVGRG
jgi:hypothetical protein